MTYVLISLGCLLLVYGIIITVMVTLRVAIDSAGSASYVVPLIASSAGLALILSQFVN